MTHVLMAFAACFPLLLQSVDLVLHELSLNDFKLWKCDGKLFFFLLSQDHRQSRQCSHLQTSWPGWIFCWVSDDIHFCIVLAFRKCLIVLQGVKLIFFSDSHLAPKFFKVVANSKKVGRHLQRQTKPFLRCQRSRLTLKS